MVVPLILDPMWLRSRKSLLRLGCFTPQAPESAQPRDEEYDGGEKSDAHAVTPLVATEVTKSAACNRINLDSPGEGTNPFVGLENALTIDGTRVSGEVYNKEPLHTHDGPVEGDNAFPVMNRELGKMMDYAYGKDIVCEVVVGHASRDIVSPISTAPAVPSGKSTANNLRVDEDGFTMVTRRKKMGPIKMQSKKNKPVRIKVPITHPPAPKDPGSKSVSHCNSMDIDTSNRFAVFDIPNSIKHNKLIEIQDDLYPPDPSMVDGTDVETNRSKCKDTEFCQMNREHANGSRILPGSILFPPKPGVSSPSFLIGPGCSGKNYNISTAQKEYIANCLKNVGSVSVYIVDQWCPGQWDYFNDLFTLMGSDPDYCIEDVDSDTENGTSQFLSGLLKSGNRNPPK
ncbi:hypothetical protein L1987_39803 [Smallanthus sonchifolius]|uniref:Uncharacterized protein n=1 Tax=Smallanthus sonchifolius TaxID=185202 RepID=A0ACB9HPD1_9ASTR|nr:hypothetical protein L1987_39803 [Smallanthus sonchifolius]